jgi:hypothetical protein
VPVTVLLKLIVDVGLRLQAVCVAGNTFMVGVGDTLTVNNCTAPIHVAAVGVTVNTPVAVTAPVLVPVKEAIAEPEPDAPIPIDVLLLAHV